MSEGNAERVIGAAASVPINLVNGLAGLSVSKGIVTQNEVADVMRSLIAQVPSTEDGLGYAQFLRPHWRDS